MKFSSFTLKVLAASFLLASIGNQAFATTYKGVYKDQPCPPPAMLKDGLYLGVEGGYDSYRVRQSTGYELAIGDASFGGSFNPSLSAIGWVGGIYLGYGRNITDLFYLGGEVLATYSGAESNFTIRNTSVSDVGDTASINIDSKFEVNNMWGLALLPGIRLNHTSLGYVRLGYSWLTLKGRVNITANNLVDLVPGSVFSTARKTDTSSGFNFGFGIETLLWENWSMRTEYTHYYYDSFTAASDPTGVTTTYNPSDNQFMLGFTYHVV